MTQDSAEDATCAAVRYHQAGRLAEAETMYRQALSRNPNHAEALRLFGVLARQINQPQVAVQLLTRSISVDAFRAEAHSALGNALADLGRFAEGAAAHIEAIRLAPTCADTHFNYGHLRERMEQFDEALGSYQRAIDCQPDHVGALVNLANVLSEIGRLDDAIEACRQALRLEPEFAEAHNALALCFKDQGRLDAAVESFRRAVALKPAGSEIHSNLIYSLYFHPDYDAQRILEEHLEWDRRHGDGRRHPVRIPNENALPERRLRIGYVSADFRQHVVGCNLLPLFREHDRESFEVYGYSNRLLSDAVTREFSSLADNWRVIAGKTDEEVDCMIRGDQIDILVDLTLHMAHNRLPLFARKPAPIQVTYLGYAGTTGMKAMDYRISDPQLDPPGADLSCYRERTVRLPRTYWCYTPLGPTPAVPVASTASKQRITFGCLNNFAKVSSEALGLWQKILRMVAGSQLLLHAPAGSCRAAISEQFERGKVTPDRLSFVGRESWDRYLESLQRIDIALDPFPYGGGITTCDALWMGVPVVTLSGRTAVGRGGRSILTNTGLPELVAKTDEQYVEIAVALANDPPRRRSLSLTLRDRMEQSPLRDAKSFTREIEVAYREMWRRWCESPPVAPPRP